MKTVLTPSVLAAQEHYYGRHASIGSAPERDPLTEEERAFIEARDSFYMATITEVSAANCSSSRWKRGLVSR